MQYLYTLAFTLAALFVQYLISKIIGSPILGFIYPTTFLMFWYFGFRAGLLSILVSALGITFFLYEPSNVDHTANLFRIGIYILTSLLTAVIASGNRNASNRELEARFALTELQKRFQRSSSALDLGIWYCDLPFDVLIWNKEVKNHFWLPEDAIVTIELFYERIHPDDREMTRRSIEESIRNKNRYDIIYRTTNPSNPSQVKHIRAIGWTEYNDKGEPIRFDGITLDNTELHSISRERDESVEILRVLNNVGKIISAELDQQKLVQQVTEVAAQLSKAEYAVFFYYMLNAKGERVTHHSIVGIPYNYSIRIPQLKDEVIRTRDLNSVDHPFTNTPKAVKSFMSVPVKSRSGEIIGALFFGHTNPDSFSEKEEKVVMGLAAQAAVAMDNAQLYDKATQAVQIRDEFLSISSHELRTPLTPLKMQIQSLGRHLEKGTITNLSDDILKKMILTADKQVLRLTSLVDDLLDVSRITSGKFNLNIEDIDLVHVIKDVSERYHPQFKSANCELHLNLPAELICKVDKLRIEQVMVNLITNAIKYAPGKPVSISLTEQDSEIRIEVQDQGAGISKEDQKRIFDRFERVSNNVSQTGLGLGLYIVNQIVTAHGGSVKVISEIDQGSSFQVRFPKKA